MNGNNQVSIARAVRGPVTLITIGILFALNNFTPYRFEQTWPVLLIVFGLLSLLRRSTDPPRPAAPPPYSPPPSNPGPEWTGGYRQSTYQDPGTSPPSGSAKGGFGSTAAPRSEENPQPASTSGETQ